MLENTAVFLDRDGTLNPDSSYINKPEDFEFYPFAISALKKLYDAGFKLIIISNQSGIGRGYIQEPDLMAITDKMKKILADYNIYLTDVFYSYYYENALNPKYLEGAEDRKPQPGMILKAAKKYNIDLSKSIMIGDKESDIGAGINAGCKTILVKTGDGLNSLNTLKKYYP
ncbi:MAG TPA: HAD family hydrolase, partial [bacterium]|nr:HAD family hydrolase [bacterium]